MEETRIYNDSRSVFIDILKVLSCLGVISIHYSAFYGTNLICIFRPLVSFSVTCFMAVSGYLLFFRKQYNNGDIYKRILPKYIVMFLLWLIIYSYRGWNLSGRKEPLLLYFCENSEGGHLWYLKIYISLLIVYPIIRAITDSKKVCYFYAVMWLVFISVRYTLGWWLQIDNIYLRLIQMPFFQYSGFLGGTTKGYYPMECLGLFILGGGFIDTLKSIDFKWYKVIMGSGLFSLIFTVALTFIIYTGEAYQVDYTCDPFMTNVIVYSAGIITLVFLVSRKHSYRVKRLFQVLSTCTLGVYIIHPLIASLVMKILTGAVHVSDGWVYKICTYWGCTVLSFFIVLCLKKVIPNKIISYILG